MIRYAPHASRPVLEGDLPFGAVAYVDADWLPSGGGDVAALVVTSDRSLLWGEEAEALAPGEDAERRVASSFLRLARRASDAVPVAARAACETPGRGLAAEWVRRLLDGARAEDGAPTAIVETRGDAASIAASSLRLADLGTLVLAGESAGAALPLDLYPNVHVRGLRLVGTDPLSPERAETSDGDEAFLAAFRGLVMDVRLGEPLPEGARCYRVSS